MSIRELPSVEPGVSGEKFPVGQITWDLPEPAFMPQYPHAEKTRIIRIIDAALEQIRPEIERAIADYGPEKIGVCLGSCDNGSEVSFIAHSALFSGGAFPEDYFFQSTSFPAEYVARKFGLKGPVLLVATACASGASAIIKGAELIKAGFCNAVIAGGADLVSDTVLMGFRALEALSDSLTNPSSKNRKGINLGEGAAFFLLDSREISDIELLGYGESSDAHHMTAPGTDGTGPEMAMRAAIQNAGIQPEHIGYVNLHGTGTPLNDLAEAKAMKTVFGGRVVRASSTKPIVGHTQGAAGTLETAVCWMVLHEQRGLPVHCWDGERDEELVFYPSVFKTEPAVTSSSETASPKEAASPLEPVTVCMNNNFGFGGCNVSLILGVKDDR
jgi:3-oxoacyl-[acyl-carrier-protein] synthase-1